MEANVSRVSCNVIYSYDLKEELPVSWDVYHDVYESHLPASYKNSVNIIMESPKEGYKKESPSKEFQFTYSYLFLENPVVLCQL